MKLLALVLLLIAGMAYGQAPKPKRAAALEATLVARERELIEAEKRGDWSAIDKILADDFFELAGDGAVYDKPAIEKLFPDVKLLSYTLSEFRLAEISSECAVLTYRIDAEATYRGQPFPGQLRASTVWTKRGGKWTVKFHQVTPIPKPPPQQP